VGALCVDCRLLQRGSMFVFSQAQFQHLLGISADWTTDTLLDLGNCVQCLVMYRILSTVDLLFSKYNLD